MVGNADAELASSEPTKLEHLQQEDASILALLRILLSVSTLPHVVTIVVLSSLLQFATVNGLEAMSAMGFLSLSGGYFLTGLLAGRPTVDRWIRLNQRDGDERSTLSRILASFRICIFPLVMSVLVFAALLAFFGEQGAVADLTSVLPWVLSSCFVVWAIVQGRGFGRWLSSVSASKLPGADAREPGLSSRSSAVSFTLLMGLTVALLYVFESFADVSNPSPSIDAMMISYGCIYKRSSKPVMKGSRVETIEAARNEYAELLKEGWKKTNIFRSYF